MGKRLYREYSDDDVRRYAAEVKSMAQLLSKLGLKPAGGNYYTMKRTLSRLNVDCSHWTGQLWSKGIRLKDWSNYKKSYRIRKHLIKECGNNCFECGLSEWLNNPIPLELDHINGDRADNRKENLRLLCCNCHALTPTWRGRNNKKS